MTVTAAALAPKEGPYPRSAAVTDLGGQRLATIVVDNHGKHLPYGGNSKSRLIRMAVTSTSRVAVTA